MENMARLAVLEQELGRHIFNEVLTELNQILSKILNNDEDARTVTSRILSTIDICKAFHDYMEYIGFEKISGKYVFPTEKSISKLQKAHAAIDKKIIYISKKPGPTTPATVPCSGEEPAVLPIEPIKLTNPFLMRIQYLFLDMRKYENLDLLEEARKHIPVTRLHKQAMERMREHQKKIKTGKTKVADLTFEIALLMELLGWFKYEFFQWVDEPMCENCVRPTRLVQTLDDVFVDNERCREEIYQCRTCPNLVYFPRLNNPRTLLRTRRGRCGEWANCFTLMCRALNYDTRYVYDVTDHVWCEVYDMMSKCWLHVDPCEGKLDTPLMYCHGWGKKLSYVFAVSRDDLQDVTWRYTTNHKEVLSRRKAASEKDIINTILTLRLRTYQQLSPARQKFLTIRNLVELASLMVERKPNDYEAEGRISGSVQWRLDRQEMEGPGTHSFVFNAPGEVGVHYCTCSDKYDVTHGGKRVDEVGTWAAGAQDFKSMFRKVETDWRMVYLARNEKEDTGSVAWHMKTETANLKFVRLVLKVKWDVFENGKIDFTIKFDDEPPEGVQFDGFIRQFERKFRSVTLRAELSGGLGESAWQHAQLFRQSFDDYSAAFAIEAKLVAE